jgi:hypothetical protein
MFLLDIYKYTPAFGERLHKEAAYQERTEVKAILERAAREIGSGMELTSVLSSAGNVIDNAHKILDSAGNEVGYYQFVAGSACRKN